MRLLLAFTLALTTSVAAAQELKIGLIPEQNVFKQRERYDPLGRYLEKRAGVKIRFTILSRYGNILERFVEERMDGAFFGSFTGALAIERLGVEPLARPVNLDGTSSYRGYLFARTNSGIRTAADMRGKRLAFVEKATTAGYLFPIAWFREQGIAQVDAHFAEVYFAGSHDATIQAVLDGRADVGCAKHSMFDRVARRNPEVATALTVLARSPDVPSNGLCVRPGLTEAVKTRLTRALLGMEADPEGRDVLEKFEALRFIPTVAEDYRGVHALAARAGIDLATYRYVNE